MSNKINNIKIIDTPKIYVACLAAYNNGKLHGKWIDADQSPEAIEENIQQMLKSSPEPLAEEWAIFNYEGFGTIRVNEWESIELIAEMAAFINKHKKLGLALLSHFCGDVREARSALEGNYCGKFRDLAEFAQQRTEETTCIPDNLFCYIDYAAMARDIVNSGDVFIIETGFEQVHVFSNY